MRCLFFVKHLSRDPDSLEMAPAWIFVRLKVEKTCSVKLNLWSKTTPRILVLSVIDLRSALVQAESEGPPKQAGLSHRGAPKDPQLIVISFDCGYSVPGCIRMSTKGAATRGEEGGSREVKEFYQGRFQAELRDLFRGTPPPVLLARGPAPEKPSLGKVSG